jgi:hypothetical protein
VVRRPDMHQGWVALFRQKLFLEFAGSRAKKVACYALLLAGWAREGQAEKFNL